MLHYTQVQLTLKLIHFELKTALVTIRVRLIASIHRSLKLQSLLLVHILDLLHLLLDTALL